MPKVSVVIITYNRGEYIKYAIESVLCQDFKDLEIIVIDDASKDNTMVVLHPYVEAGQIRYFKNENNRGIVFNRNRGLELSGGKYVAILDSDDLWCDVKKLSKQVDFLENNPDFALIGGNVRTINSAGKVLGKIRYLSTDSDIKKNILLKNQFANSSVLYDKEKIVLLGGYNDQIDGCNLEAIEDYNLALKIGTRWKLANLSETVLEYRIHGGNISKIRRLDLMKKNIVLVKHYGEQYPNRWLALVRRYVRYVVYKIISKFL